MGKGKAPKPVDPQKASAAQTGTSIGTAIANNWMNNMDQVTPDGTLTYETTGTETYRDPFTGKSYEIPRTTVTQTLSEAGQNIRDADNRASLNMSNLAADQSGRLNDLLGTPLEMSNEAVESRLFDLGRQRLDPMLEQQRDSLVTRLSSQGIKEGSEAFDRAMSRHNQGSNDAYNQLLLSGRGQAMQELTAQRNQPINEITALMSGSQVSQPQFANTGGSQIATTDNAGLMNQAYQQKFANWQQQQQQGNALAGGLFGLASAGIGMI